MRRRVAALAQPNPTRIAAADLEKRFEERLLSGIPTRRREMNIPHIPFVPRLPEAPLTGTSPAGTGVTGESNMGVGVIGACIGGPGADVTPISDGVLGTGKNGVHGRSSSATDSGVWGENTGGGFGVNGSTGSGVGVNGHSTQGIGVLGSSIQGNGVEGVSTGATGVRGTSPRTGVQGDSDPSGFNPPTNVGVWGDCNSGFGVIGSSSQNTGVFGYSDGAQVAQQYAPFTFVGVHGQVNSSRIGQYNFGFLSHVGVYGDGGTKGCGVYGRGGDGTPAGSAGIAALFEGNVQINGSLYKQGGGFRIDHPLEPERKYLYHSFVESSERKNVYDGVVNLGPDGAAVIQLPDWLQELNEDFRYQLTPVGGPAPDIHVAKKIAQGCFKIAGGTPGMEICWQVTGNRRDAWAQANRIPVEQQKIAPRDEKL